ncbi:MAG: tRNA pseudouridine synthase A [Acidaminobacteraceae bacterium]
MKNYKMKIAYDGKRYMGFKKDKFADDKSINGKMSNILKKLYTVDVDLVSAVNTGADVHATHQIVNFKAPNDKLDMEAIHKYFENYLPDDIIVLEIEEVDERFQSRFLLKNLTYQYRIWKSDAPRRPLFERNYVNVMQTPLNVEMMKEAATLLEGEHDFAAFTTNPKIRNSEKEMISIEIDETETEIVITMKATGFLLNMERLIPGTLIQVGLGERTVSSILRALDTQDMKDAGHKAMAPAITLTNIEY